MEFKNGINSYSILPSWMIMTQCANTMTQSSRKGSRKNKILRKIKKQNIVIIKVMIDYTFEYWIRKMFRIMYGMYINKT